MFYHHWIETKIVCLLFLDLSLAAKTEPSTASLSNDPFCPKRCKDFVRILQFRKRLLFLFFHTSI